MAVEKCAGAALWRSGRVASRLPDELGEIAPDGFRGGLVVDDVLLAGGRDRSHELSADEDRDAAAQNL